MHTSLRSALLGSVLCLAFASAIQAQTGAAQSGAAQTGNMQGGTMSMPASGSQGAPAKPMASPPATADVLLNGKTVLIKYNSPQMRGRTIMGEVVPYGKVWRTGANPATSLVTATDLRIGDLRVPAGSYTLFTLPAAPGTPWMLIVNKQTGQWGLTYHQEQDLGRTPMMSKTLAAPQEAMSITFENTTGNSTELHIKWETTDEWVKVEAR